MVVLPSGRIIDISIDRARHHALRQSGISPQSHHRVLYKVTDIIYRNRDEDGNIKRGWTEFDYCFSGYTLDTVRQAQDWTEADKRRLFNWLREQIQYQKIERARRRLADNQQQLSAKIYSSPRFLYSLLYKRIADSDLNCASAKQWLATILNMKQKGLRDEEISWSSLYHYLTRQPAKKLIHKTQILENINFSKINSELSIEQLWGENGGLSFNEVAQRMPHQAVYRAALKLDENCLCILRYVDSCCNYRVGVIKTLNKNHPMRLKQRWFALDPYGRAIKNVNKFFFDNSVDAKLAADRHAHNELGIRSGAKIHTHFDHLTLYGGKDYREWKLSLPDYQRIYFGKHFYDHNVLVHIRTTTREDTFGRKILFLEEVQSDWHQSAKYYGYNNNSWGRVANAPFKKEWPVLAIKIMLIHACQNGFSGIAWPDGAIQEIRYSRSLNSIRRYYDKDIPDALNKLGNKLDCQVEKILISTREPWLNIEKSKDKWRVYNGEGKFKTRARYNNREEAMSVISRHCRKINLEVSAMIITAKMSRQIFEKGLPLFGHTLE